MLRFLLFFLIIFFHSARADQLIIEPDMGRKPILDFISETHHSLDLVIYGFTDPTILNAILQKKAEGKTVRLILEGHPYKSEGQNNKTIALLNAHDVAWHQDLPSIKLIHQKTLMIDDAKAMVMTFNFTRSTFRNERNFALILNDNKRVKAIARLFSADWNQITPDAAANDLIISPDNSRRKLLALLDHAKSSIRIYAQGFNDYKIVGAIANAAKRSVEVEIITSNHMREKQERYLKRAGVKIHYCKKLMIHAKVFVIDNRLAVLGSINLTRASLEDNRELSVVSEDRNVIAGLNRTFEEDWQDGTGSGHNFREYRERYSKDAEKLVKKYLRKLLR